MDLRQMILSRFPIISEHMTLKAIDTLFILKLGHFVWRGFREKKTSSMIVRTKPSSSTKDM